jgi:hypothetical protein
VKTRNWIAAIAGLLVCLGIAYGAYELANYSWNQVVDYRGPYAKQALPEGTYPAGYGAATGSSAKLGRVVYIIVDGLREDVSRTMPALNNLRARGFDAVVRTSQPSLSFPNWTTLMSGAPQRISGVTTNWFTEKVPVETLVDVAMGADRTMAVSAPTDFEQLYGVERTGHTFLRDWEEGVYMSGEITDKAISLGQESGASFLLVHLPDIDEAGHASGGASQAYRDMALKVDGEIGRLVAAFQAPDTTFVIAADHGHIDTGGHGGPEDVVTLVPAVFVGPNVRLGKGEGTQDQVAPTIALLADLALPRNATGAPFDIAVKAPLGSDRVEAQQVAAYSAYTRALATNLPGSSDATAASAADARAAFDKVTDYRLGVERSNRLPVSLALWAACAVAIVAVGLLAWRGLIAAIGGTIAYYLVYHGLFFVVHGYRWSLSAFNSEALLKPFLNGRMVEALIAGVVAAVVAAEVYLALRADPKRPTGEYLPGWIALGTATILVIQASIVAQVAWYLWYWGASVTWYIPDLAMGFKYDLDLIQLTGLGASAILAPVVTYLIGRFHPFPRVEASK